MKTGNQLSAVIGWLSATIILAGGCIVLANLDKSPANRPAAILTSRWRQTELKLLPLAYRHDGFSMYFYTEPPMTRATLQERFIDPFGGSHVKTLVWGLGPGSVFCYDTKVGEIFGDPLTEEQWQMCRPQDRWVNQNVHALIDAGADPLHVAAERGHELGLKVYGRLEMNAEYAPDDPNNWMGVAFTGSFNKQHPEYRIPGTPFLDFAHKEVRAFKLAIFREVVDAGMDGVYMDFIRKPPYFATPDCNTMTQFIRDCRSMLDEIGAARGEHLDIMVRVPFVGYIELGIDWKTWMREGLVDIVVPSFTRVGPGQQGYQFFVPVDEFVRLGEATGTKVYACIWHDLGLVSHDPAPDGRQRYAKPKTKEMYFAEALLYHRSGVCGIELARSTGDEWLSRSWENDLADPGKVEFADKHYMVDVGPYIPVEFPLSSKPPFISKARVPLLVADDIRKARAAGHSVDATLVFYCRGLQEGEELSIYINGNGPVTVVGGLPEESEKQAPVKWEKHFGGALIRPASWIFEKDWWKRGEHRVPIEPTWLRMGKNTIRFVYSTELPDVRPSLWISWIDLLLEYNKCE